MKQKSKQQHQPPMGHTELPIWFWFRPEKVNNKLKCGWWMIGVYFFLFFFCFVSYNVPFAVDVVVFQVDPVGRSCQMNVLVTVGPARQ